MSRLAFVAALSLLFVAPSWAQTPDTVLLNGKVVTVDALSTIQEAIAVRD